jgi:hypothetical protein
VVPVEIAVEPLTDAELHKKYVTKRRRWARAIGRPYAGHEAELPEPATFDGEDPELG